MEKIVKVAACDKRYEKGEVYWALPYEDPRIANYVTGQERSVDNPNGLTKRQIEMLDPLTDEDRKKYHFPIVMDPNKFRGVAISRATTFNLSTDDNGNYVNPIDKEKYEFFIKGQTEKVATSKDKIIPGKHLFFLVDDNRDAQERNSHRRIILEAQQLVFNKLTKESFYELFIYINHNKNTSYSTLNAADAIIEDRVYELCEKYPADVKKFFNKETSEELFILKLVHYGIIFVKAGSFVDKEDKYLGSSVREVLSHLSKKGNHLLALAWKKSLQSKDVLFAKSLESDKDENPNENK